MPIETDRSTRSRLQRLAALEARLATGGTDSVAELAREMGVSERTLTRDLRLLREQGAVIEGSSGPGGGIRLAAGSTLPGHISLRESQAIELLLALAVSEALGLSLGGSLSGLRAQLTRAFAPADRLRILELRQRIRVAHPVSQATQQTRENEVPSVRHAVHAAFVQRRMMTLQYRDGAGQVGQRSVETHALLLAWPFWYLMAWDVERDAVRTFRLDRISKAEVQPQVFRPRPLDLFWAHCEGVGAVL